MGEAGGRYLEKLKSIKVRRVGKVSFFEFAKRILKLRDDDSQKFIASVSRSDNHDDEFIVMYVDRIDKAVIVGLLGTIKNLSVIEDGEEFLV